MHGYDARVVCVYESDSPACDDGDIFDGGYWWGRFWVPGLVSEEKWSLGAPPYSVGRAVWYAEGVMEANMWLRWEWGQLDRYPSDYVDGVALMSPANIGDTVWLRAPGRGWEGPFVVADCAQRDDIYAIVRYRREVVEVGWETKQRWGMTTPLNGVEVVVAPDAYGLWRVLETHYEPVDYREWWLSR